MEWVKLYVYMRKEEFVFVIDPNEENRAANKEHRWSRKNNMTPRSNGKTKKNKMAIQQKTCVSKLD